MNLIPAIHWKREWRQLLPRCSNAECAAARRWPGVLHRVSGFRLNGSWYCGAHCLEAALEKLLLTHVIDGQRPAPNRTAMPLGLMMLARGAINDLQLRDAIQLQRSTGARIGQCLQQLGLISAEEIASAVATQWGCPLFPAESVQAGCSMLVPFSLVERYCMSPVHLVSQGRRLVVAFSERVNHSLLIAIEQTLGCTTEACIVPETMLAEVIDYRKQESAGEVAVRRPERIAEVVRMILNYAHQTQADEIRLNGAESNVWVRFLSPRAHFDLVFEAAAPHL